jgi:hypothetical protein
MKKQSILVEIPVYTLKKQTIVIHGICSPGKNRRSLQKYVNDQPLIINATAR